MDNIAAEHPAIADTLAVELDHGSRQNSSVLNTTMSAEQIARLGALGYVATGGSRTSSASASREEGADPKDKIEIANLMHEALMAIEDNHYKEAVPELQRILTRQPDFPAAQFQLGLTFLKLNSPEEAIPLLRDAAKEQQDESGAGHYELGLALFAVGNYQQGIFL